MRKPLTRVGFAIAAFIAALLATTGLPGCQQLFTTSLAEPLARDSISLPDTLTSEQAADLAQQAQDSDNVALATALVDTLTNQITDPSTQTELAAAAASAAIVASGASDALLDAFADVLASGDTSTVDAAALLATIQAGSTADVLTALGYLEALSDPSSIEGTELNATDYVIAAIIVAASALPAGTDPVNDDLSGYTGSAQYTSAAAMVATALTMVDSGSASEDLLNNLASLLQIP